jgi:PAS domain S-box-containing protein
MNEVKKTKEQLEEINERLKQDILKHKQLEKELLRAKDYTENLIQHSRDMIISVDTNRKIIVFNRAAEETFGYTKEEVLGKHVGTLYADSSQSLLVYKTTKDTGKFEGEILNRRKDGSTFIARLSSAVLGNGNGDTTGLMGISRDITERKKMEEELKKLNESLEQRVIKRTQELARANEELAKMQKLESLGILAGGIAHDFNNNLQAILSSILLAKTCANPKDEIYKKLKEAEKITLQAKGLSKQLLTFSRGGWPVKKTIYISELIRDSANLALSGSNVRCELDIPDNLWPVEADEGQLNQVFSNLIINANQAIPEGRIIKVKAENTNAVEKGSLLLKETRYLKISIEDHGTGISQENLQKIFDPYFTTKQKGSGLGLAIAYSIIKKHGGHITVESEIGVGTTFHIYLPASHKEPLKKHVLHEGRVPDTKPLEEKHEEEESSTSKGKVLLMDDEGIIRLAVAKYLKQIKYEVETARDGTEAIKLYKKAIESGKPFDAVIVDLTISGGMGGKETIKRLLEIDSKVRAIASSGYTDDPIMADFRKYGFSGKLAKPYEMSELIGKLQ